MGTIDLMNQCMNMMNDMIGGAEKGRPLRVRPSGQPSVMIAFFLNSHGPNY